MKPVIGTILILFLAISSYPAIDRAEIETLFQNQKYAILLEKCITLLNRPAAPLSSEDKEFLNYHIAASYQKSGNLQIAKSYFRKLEKSYPNGRYIPFVYEALAELNRKNRVVWLSYIRKLASGSPKTPEAFDANMELGKEYIRQRKFNYAINTFEKIVNEWGMGDRNPESYILLTMSYSKTDAFLDALDYLRTAVKKAGKIIRYNADYLFEMSKIYYKTQNYNKAVDGFIRMLNIFPDYKLHTDILLYLADALMKVKRYHNAAFFLIEGIYKNRSAVNSGSAENKKKFHTLLLKFTELLMKLDKEQRAVFRRKYENFTDIDKNLTRIKNNSFDYNERRKATLLLNNKFLLDGDYENVIANLYRFLRKNGDTYIRSKFRQYIKEYLKEIKSEKNINAIFRLWVLIKPRKSLLDGQNLIEFANYFKSVGMYKNAEDIYHHISKYTLYRDYWNTAQFQLAKIKFENGEYQSYLDLYRKLVFIGEKSSAKEDEFKYYRIVSLQKLKRTEDADKIIKAVDIPDIQTVFQVRLLRKKGDWLTRQRKYAEALDLYQRVLSRSSNVQEQLEMENRIADLFYLTDQLDKALAAYNQLELKNGKIDWILFQKINIYKKKKDGKQVKTVSEKLKKQYPDSFWLKQLNKNV